MKKFYLLLYTCFFFFNHGFAQTPIEAINSGGFDAGTTFLSNGWIVVNSSANKWVVGSKIFLSAPNSAYISKDSVAATPGQNNYDYDYDNTKAHISHFYQKITLPANAVNINLSFNLIGNNESFTPLHDGLLVYADPSLTVPVKDVLPGGSAQFLYIQPGQNTLWVLNTTTLDYAGVAGTSFYLIFTWVNDGNSIGAGPPAAIDDLSLSYCIASSNFNVTGGGAFCKNGPGVHVGLDGSTEGISYQLYDNLVPVGSPVPGTGAALDFGLKAAVGNYTVVGTSGCEVDYPMNGSVDITENPLPIASGGSNGPLCFGATLKLTSAGGSTYSWTGPNSFTSALQNPTIDNFSAANAGTYVVTVTDNNGCTAPATINVAVTAGTANGGLLPSKSICNGGSGTLKLTGNTNNPDHWEYTTDSTSTTWNAIVNTTTTLNFSGISVPTFYRAVMNDGCSNVYSDIATVSIHNLWTGVTSSDWNTGSNWSDGQVPSTSCPTVQIPVVPLGNYPVLSTGAMATINSLQIDAGASLTITGNTIQIAGGILNNGDFDATDGTVELNGSVTKNIVATNFKNVIPGRDKTVKNLIISDNVNLTGALIDTLNITGTLSFGAGMTNTQFQIQAGVNLTLKSSATATANVGVIDNGNTITGDVIVERYVQALRNWQFLSLATNTTQTIQDAWQEGQPSVVPNGYGTNITGPVADPTLDFVSPNPSMKYWDNGTQAYINITHTNIPFPDKQNGFFLYIRGDRNANATTGNTPTVMRTKGPLYTGAVPFTIPDGAYYSIGNPYASAVNFGAITAGLGEFYVWDPLLSGERGVGGYQTFSGVNLYEPTAPNSTSYYQAGTSYPNLESGQAAFVYNNTGSSKTLTFNEANKVNGSHLVFRGGETSSASGFLRTYLYNAAGRVTDGNAVAFNSTYQNKLDAKDAIKIRNNSENLGLRRDGVVLAVEARNTVSASDTIYFDLKNVSKETYKFGFNPANMQDAGVTAYLADAYLKTQKEISLTGPTTVDFTVTSEAGSYAANRFMVVFKEATVLPVTFVSVKAVQKDKDIVVNWNMANENNMLPYEVEKSLDGNNFVKAATVAATNTGAGNYQWIDQNAVPGNNYYRIKSVDKSQKVVYSTVVNVLVTNLKTGISIYPNPITDAVIHLQFINQPKGKYRIRLLDPLGQLILAKQIDYAGGNGSEEIKWNYKMARGIYDLEITREDGSKVIIKVLY